jgi:hypothetical protein
VHGRREEDRAMKKILLGITMFLLASAGSATAQPKPLKIVMSPNSTVPRSEIIKKINEKCPNVGVTLDSVKSNFMLEAWGWSGRYRFTVFKHGGDAVFSTSTAMLSNAVKDVCKFLNSPSAQE